MVSHKINMFLIIFKKQILLSFMYVTDHVEFFAQVWT